MPEAAANAIAADASETTEVNGSNGVEEAENKVDTAEEELKEEKDHKFIASMVNHCAGESGIEANIEAVTVEFSPNKLSRCVTKTQLLWSLTMAPACAKPVSPVMTPPGLSSHPLLDVPATRVSWSVWDKRMPMLEMKLNPREVSLP